jgi:phosphatidylglycerophosphate synthase
MTAVTTAVLLETGPDLAWEDTTVGQRLAGQLRDLGVEEVHVLRGPAVADTLAAIAAIARAAPGGVVVTAADLVTQREALAGLLADPRIATGVLSSGSDPGAGSFGLRSDRGRVIAAASPYHVVGAPSEWFLGALKVTASQTGELAAVAERLAPLVGPGWGDDATALLLVALVRAGVHVGQSDLRELFWARPASSEDVARARAEIVGHDEERVLLDSAVKAIDGFFTTFFVSPYSKYIARWAARRGLTPNQVTTTSLLLGALAAAAFATGERWGLIAGAVLLQVAFTTDCVDGQLARFTRTFTPLGAWLDSTFDRLKEYLVFGGLALGAAHAGDPVWTLAGAALALQTVRHAFDFSFAAAEHQSIDSASQRPLDDPSDGWAATTAGAPAPPATGAARILRSWRRIDRAPGAIWLKRMLVFPIGERFAAISLTAALWTPRTTFVVVLAWGAVGAVYGLAGRVLRALLRPARGGRA